MLNILAVFIGGGIGACVRYFTGILCSNTIRCNLPIATFLVNIIGCFLIGFFYIMFVEKIQYSNMIQKQMFMHALLYAVLSIILGFAAVYFGGYCAKFL